ncbi:MAG: flippase-like domain-containing protein [Candidatus Marinimicrobia bacterium]|nr:flippase-like domain-containing protein [Candidatus Neomarinimicrobiota bacterium]
MVGKIKSSRQNKILGHFLKIAVSTVILYFLFSSINISQLSIVLSTNGGDAICLVFILGIILWFVEYLRFYISTNVILKKDTNDLLLQVFFSGYAMRFMIPGGLGEVGKMMFVPGKYSMRLIAYLADKGSLALAILIGGLAGVWSSYPQTRVYYWILLVVMPGAFLVVRRIVLKKNRLLIDEPDYPFKKVLIFTIPLSFIHVFIVTLQYWLILRSANIPLSTVFMTVNIVLFAVMIPISFAGIGVREWTSLQLLRQFAISKETAIVAPLLVFVCNVLIPALIGVAVMLIFKMKPTLIRRKQTDLH